MSRGDGAVTTRDMEGKVAVVTGGTRGIGRAIALELASRGANIVSCYLRKRSAAEQTTQEIEGHGVKAVAVRANVGEADNIERLFQQVDETFGRVDVLVSNAATGVIRPLPELDEKAWEWTLNANARALLLTARGARPLMGDGSSIISLSSGGANRVLPGYAVVGASKSAIESLTRYLAVELAPGIRANAVSPGVVDTDALTHFPMREEMLSHAKATTPAGRLVTPEDVAKAVAWLASEDAAMITGQVITIDGGASVLA